MRTDSADQGKKGGRITMQVAIGRSEKRIPKAVGVTARFSDGTSLPEGTVTENIGVRGARIVTTARLQEGGMVVIHFPTEVQFHGRVVYCHHLPDGRFAVGLEMQDSSQTSKARRKNPL